MSVSWYKKGTQGRLSIREKSTIDEINEIVKSNNIDTSNWSTMTTIDDLEDLRDDLIDDYGDPDIEDQNTSEKSEEIIDENNDQDYVGDSNVQKQTNEEVLDLGDFVETESEHAFTDAFKEEDMFKVDGGSFNNSSEQPPESGQTIEDPLAILKKKQRVEQISNTVPSFDNGDTESDSDPDNPQTEEDKKKVALGKKTKRKATKQFADKIVTLLELIVEATAKSYAKYPDKKLQKAVDDGLLDLSFVFGTSQETVKEFIDNYRQNLNDAISTDEEMHEEMVDAVLLYMEEQEIEVTPKTNLGITIATYIISVGVEAHKQRQSINRAVEQMKQNYALHKTIFEDQKQKIQELETKLEWQSKPKESIPKPLEFNLPKKTTDEKPQIKLVGDPEEQIQRKKDFTESENMIETIQSPVMGDSKPVKLKK